MCNVKADCKICIHREVCSAYHALMLVEYGIEDLGFDVENEDCGFYRKGD